MKKIKTVGIIGGNGKMGTYFTEFFENRDFHVIVSDIDTLLSNEEVAKKSDILIFSVPIKDTVKIIESVNKYIKKDTILFDVTSIKKPMMDAMLKTKAKEVVGGHPMFAPTVSIIGQVFMLCPGRGEKGLKYLETILNESGAKVKIIDAKKHDDLMSIVQAMNHFTDISFARALSKTGFEIHDFLEFQSPSYRLKLIMMGRILAQNSCLYGSIMTQNPNNEKMIKLIEESVDELMNIVKNKDLESFEKYFNESAKYLNDFAEIAMKESDHIIEQMFQRKLDDCTDEEKKADIAILGPKNTYTDYACDEAFGDTKSRKYCRSIREIFENVSDLKCEFGLVPVENKLSGSVHETYDALWEFEDIEVIKEMKLKIVHVLASLKNIPYKNIEKVFSHVAALGQCSRFFENYRNIKKIPVSSTAEAVLHLTHNSAAIIPLKSAKKQHLAVLKYNISNSEDNYTRFCLIRKKDNGSIIKPPKNCLRTLLAFELFKTKAGALLKVLQVFYEYNINLLKLESKPVGNEGDTIFFVDTEGALTEQQIKHLEKSVVILKVFGMTELINN